MVAVQKLMRRQSSSLRVGIRSVIVAVLLLSLVLLTVLHSRLNVVVAPQASILEKANLPEGAEEPVEKVQQQGSYSFTETKACAQGNKCHVHYPIVVTPQNVKQPSDITFEREDFYMMTQKGMKGGPNQDRIFAVSMPDGFVAGLFDGHGINGHFTAELASTDMRSYLWNKLDGDLSDERIRQIFTDAFLETDKGRLSKVRGGGCTAIVVWQHKRRIVLASAGDSTALVGVWNGTAGSILTETIHHKPADPPERARIEGAGGLVSIPPEHHDTGPFDSSRVIIGQGQAGMGLAMSRCLGDMEGKKNGVLSAEPAIQIVDLPANVTSAFLMISSDGTVDFFNLRRIAHAVGSSFFDKSYDHSPSSTCRDMIKQSTDQWAKGTNNSYRDDMSVMVAKLDIK